MTYTIEYSKEAERTLRKWKKSNPNLFKKATKILMDIMQHPRTGLGHHFPPYPHTPRFLSGVSAFILYPNNFIIRGFFVSFLLF